MGCPSVKWVCGLPIAIIYSSIAKKTPLRIRFSPKRSVARPARNIVTSTGIRHSLISVFAQPHSISLVPNYGAQMISAFMGSIYALTLLRPPHHDLSSAIGEEGTVRERRQYYFETINLPQ
jgi:hypothetical protein